MVRAALAIAAILDDGRMAQVAFALGHYRHLKKLHSYLLLNRDKPLCLSQAAAHVGISPSRLSHLFQEKTGIPFSRWIRRERVLRAKELLEGSDAPISEIAVAAGFRCSRTFERAFKQGNGISPSDYRKRVQSQNDSDFLSQNIAPSPLSDGALA
jgi:transcriptional regulator GlxA family with amidase domain